MLFDDKKTGIVVRTKRGNVDLKNAMGILRDVAEEGTTSSVAYVLRTKELYFSVYQTWDIIYHLTMP